MRTNFGADFAWLDRVVEERDDLATKILRLHDYLRTSKSVDDNGPEARELLLEQEEVMKKYKDILNARIEIGIAEYVEEHHTDRIADEDFQVKKI